MILYKYVHTCIHRNMHLKKAIHIYQKMNELLHLNTRKVLIAKHARLKHQAENNQNISSSWCQVQIPHTYDTILYILQTTSKTCKCRVGVEGGTQTPRILGIWLFFKISELGPEWGKQTTNAQNLGSATLKGCTTLTFMP